MFFLFSLLIKKTNISIGKSDVSIRKSNILKGFLRDSSRILKGL